MTPSPITIQPQAGTSVPELSLFSEAGVVAVLVTDVVCEGVVAVFVSTTVVDGPGTVTVLVRVEVTVLVDVVAGVVLAASALTDQASAAPATSAVPALAQNQRVIFTDPTSGQGRVRVITRFG